MWFKKRKKELKEKENVFSIEYYPLTERYYPKYKSYYLYLSTVTGIIEKKEPFLFAFASYGKTQEEAEKFIVLFKEQRLKEGVVVIKECKI